MIEIKVDSERLAKALSQLARAMDREGRAIANRQVAIAMRGWVMDNFDTEGQLRLPGVGWEPLAESTLMRRAVKGVRGRTKRRQIRLLYRHGKTRAQVVSAMEAAYAKTNLGGYMILQDTGQLRQSFHEFSDDEIAGVGARNYVAKDGRRAPVDLAAIHEYGHGRIPARPMLPTREDVLDIGLRVYEMHIDNARREVGL